MATIDRSALVAPGEWRTLERGWNITFSCIFNRPEGARVKVRYGNGRWLGWNSQLQTLTGDDTLLRVTTGASKAGARVQIRVKAETMVYWRKVTTGDDPLESPLP